MHTIRSLALALGAASLATVHSAAQSPASLDSATLAALRWRPVGPANMSGRVSDVEGIPSPSRTFYFAAAAGGIWKTTNAGTTFRPVFQNERCISMGDLAIAPSDTNVLYAGTGEEDSRNSISPGCGVFKSTDGGKTWKLMGLEKSGAIGRILVHPRDPNTAYVAALGQIWGSNPERGLYKTTDGGSTWTLVKFISDKAGFVDLAMDPSNPDILYASSWERVRGPYFLRSGGPGSALWKTVDAGKTWIRIEGGGFPETMKGRIGLAVAPSDPSVVYALVEADSVRGKKPQKLLNGLYRSSDAGKTWTKMADQNVRPFYYSQVRVHPRKPDKVWWSSTPVNFSEDGGKTVRQATVGLHVDHHAMWIDPNDPEHHIVGNDGGVAQSWDGGGNYDFMNSVPLGQFYEASYDFAVPYRVCGGLQDNGSWCGPSRRKQGDITNAMWFTFNGGDGFFTAQDPMEPNIIYGESQGGNIARFDFATGVRQPLVKPAWRPRYMQVEDSILVTRGDTSRPVPPAVTRSVAALRRQQRADSADLDLRWNWNTPFLISAHNPHVFYAAANRVLKSTKRGDDLRLISPDLSRKLWPKIDTSMRKTGGITLDATGAETYGTIVALAESQLRPGLLYAGTDDGNVWITRNDGGSWEDVSRRFPGLPENSYVRRIEVSRFDTGTVYVAFDNHRVNDFAPYIYVSTDFGRTFRSIVNNLPTGGPDFVHVIREDPHNRDLLFVGTDVGVYVSRDRGAHWSRFMTGLPTVPVHDLQIHPRDHELIAATHGRSIWIVDILPLEQLTDSVVRKVAHLFAPRVAYQYGESPVGGESPGHKLFTADSPPYGAELYYRVTRSPPMLAQTTSGDSAKTNGAPVDSTLATPSSSAAAADTSRGNGARGGVRANRLAARIVITDVRGDTVKTLAGLGGPGLHKAVWDLRGKPAPPSPLGPAAKRDSIVAARKTESVLDSLAKAGTSAATIQAVRNSLGSGDVSSLFQRGARRGAPGEFIERPGESAPPRQQAAAGAPDPEAVADVLRILRQSGALRNTNFFGGGGPPLAAPGEYLVTITVAGETMKQVLRVERVSGGPGEAVGVRDTKR
ncbi:MAG: glycosyl hydrolase [Anaerolineae bacterium]|nr:glycosyl hydrolase [Gemmatimonadaceae bacterium]